MHTITVWTDIGCPWSYVACLRLHRMRDRLGATDVELDFRARPSEMTEEPPRDALRVQAEITALAQLEHTAFSGRTTLAWPTTTFPALEAQKWGYSLGPEVGERFDLALRRAVFLHGHDVSRRDQLIAVADVEGLEATSLAHALDHGTFRSAVAHDVESAATLDLEGTPVLVLPNGSSHVNPGMTVEWIRGLPIIRTDHPAVYEEIIREAATAD